MTASRAGAGLIPVSNWAEAEGQKGQMTRTWYSLPGGDPFAVAGVWRATSEWGNAYSMVMADGHPQMADVHDRMPVILQRDDWVRWTDGSPDEAFALCSPWQGELIVDRTATPWAAARVKPDTLLILAPIAGSSAPLRWISLRIAQDM